MPNMPSLEESFKVKPWQLVGCFLGAIVAALGVANLIIADSIHSGLAGLATALAASVFSWNNYKILLSNSKNADQ